MYLGKAIVDSLKDKDEAFLTWYYPKPNEPNSSYKKIGFNIHFKPYDWFIGTGEYFVDFEEMVKNEITEYLSNFKTDRNDYFFILDYNNKRLFQKINGSSDKSFRDLDSSHDIALFDNIVTSAKNNEKFITYDYKLDNVPLTKTSYIKNLPNWKWVLQKVFIIIMWMK